jgi:anti-sigma regulatory factor (Ser/Thr protein kinase)
VAQWILAHRQENRYTFVDCPPPMGAYLTNIRFKDALVDPQIVVSPDPMDWAIGLTRINRDLSTELVTQKIVDILTTFTNLSQRDQSALVILISEMIENVHRHAAPSVDGFAVAQVYPRRLKMGITLVDAGIGVRKSFEEGEPSIDISSLRTDEDFLRAALALHATSKSTLHSGYGLYLLSELISRNRGTFLISSGNATLLGYRQAGKLHLEPSTHQAWLGTIVSVIIDLSRDLPLRQIYKEMPLEEGMTHEDYFAE